MAAGVMDFGIAAGSTAANYFLQRDAAARNQQYYRENIKSKLDLIFSR